MNAEQEKLTEIEQLRQDRDRLKWMVNYAGICELSAHNFNLKSWADELEERAIKAEKERDEARRERNQALKEAKTWEARHDGALNERDEAQAKLTAALAANAEMRDALIPFQCETCNGTHVFTFECPSCLSGEGSCTCSKQQPEPCPQCRSDNGLRDVYAKLEHALSLESGKGFHSPAQVRELEELHRMQLVAIMGATLQNTAATIKDRIGRENVFWTLAYDDVCRAVDREIQARAAIVHHKAQVRELIGPVLVFLDRLAKLPNTNIDNHWIAFNAIHELARLEAALKDL